MEYKLQFNLQQRTALSIAISFWEREEVKDKAAEILKSYRKFLTKESRQKWREFTKTAVDKWNMEVLPPSLEIELIHIIIMIGDTIFFWYQKIIETYKKSSEAMSFIDEIKWTPYGIIDEVQTFKSFWLENPKFYIADVYNFACRYAISDHINDLWNKIPSDVRNDSYEDVYGCSDRHILAYWKHYRDNDLPTLIRHFQTAANDFNGQNVLNRIYDTSCSIEENMLRLSVHQGYYITTKYFWGKLTHEERHESVIKCARIAVVGYFICLINKDIRGYEISKYAEICIFLMNQMTKDHKKIFFNEKLYTNEPLLANHFDCSDVKDDILKMLLSTWPLEELFIPVLKDMLQCRDDDSSMDCAFLEAITHKMVEDHKLGYSLKNNKYRYLLREVWFIIPASIKQKIERYFKKTFIDNLIDVWDLSSLKLILNDPKIAAVRNKFINFGKNSYKLFIKEDQFEKLDYLIEELFKLDDEKKFKRRINPWEQIFEDHKVNLADKLLDWQSSTPEERQTLKNKINHIKLCKIFIENDSFETLDKFLDWKFEIIEEKIKCKNHFKQDIFAVKHIYDTWSLFELDVDDAKQRSSRFLCWIFESDEEIKRFKKQKLANLEVDPLLINPLVAFELNGIIDEFLSWCLLNNNKIQRIKLVVSWRIGIIARRVN